MTGTREALEQLRSMLAEVLRFDDGSRWAVDELLATAGALEALGRLVDAHRAACAGEIAERSRVELGDARLSTRNGCRSAIEFVERVTQVSAFEARRRIVLGTATRARSGFSGEPIAAAFPVVAAALAAGDLGADAAGTIIRELDRTRTVADPLALAAAEQPSSTRRPGRAMARRFAAPPTSCGCGRRPGPPSWIKTVPSPTTSARCDAGGSGWVERVTGSCRSPASSCPRSLRSSRACSMRTSRHARVRAS